MSSGWTVDIAESDEDEDEENAPRPTGILIGRDDEKDEDIFSAIIVESDRGKGVAVTFENGIVVLVRLTDPDKPDSVSVLGYGIEQLGEDIDESLPRGENDSELGKVRSRIRFRVKPRK